jgi:methylmalonyl-CoA/ethylmalonyl-CoA epimerase
VFKKLDHVSIVVTNIDETLKRYRNLFDWVPWDKGVTNIPEHGIKVALLPFGDNSVELIEPTDNRSRFAKFLKERGQGPFHLCFFIDDFDAKVKALKEKGLAVEEEEAKNLFPGHTVRLAWLPSEISGGFWIELVDVLSLPSEVSGI